MSQDVLTKMNNEENNIQNKKDYDNKKLRNWIKFEYIPNKVVVDNMPKNEINLYYQNDNDTRWNNLVKHFKYKNDEELSALFKVAYAIGVFSKKEDESENATLYFLNNILSKYNAEKIVSMFSNFDTYNNLYDNRFAKVFMIYFFITPNFLWGDFYSFNSFTNFNNDCLAFFHNNFKQFMSIMKNKSFFNKNSKNQITRNDIFKYYEQQEGAELSKKIDFIMFDDFRKFAIKRYGDKILEDDWMNINELKLIVEFEDFIKDNKQYELFGSEIFE